MTDYPALHMLIAGEKVTGGGRDTEEVINPATEEVLGTLPHATSDDLDRALDAAQSGFREWRSTSADKRATILTNAANLIRERKEDIAGWLTREQGKPLGDGRGEAMYSANLLEFYAQEAKRTYGRTLVRGEGSRVEVQYHPVGPVAGFAPWNFPAINVMRKIGGALAAGCSVIVKPSEETPAAGIALVQALLDAGVPGGAVQCVFGVPSNVSEHLLASPIIRKLTFTGSTPVGKHLAKLAADDLKITTMELGGHGPVLVFDDCDVDKAVKTMAGNKYRNAGQVCVSPIRFLIEESIFEQFRDSFVERAEKVRVGNGLEDGTDMGPMANARGRENIQKLIANAKEAGANLLTGGEVIGNQGFFHQPTVLSEVPTSADIMNNEPFGPVAILNPMSGEDAMIEEANRLPYGLAAYAWTDDAARRRRLAAEVEAGMLAINGGSVSTVDAPFGGVKWSGYGSEDGREGVMACMVPKTIHES
ncbi:NAD-dependent succinate-semialdehyde dehydrogenase [Aurantiacibacter gangjinensis]|uniref:Aldehyde dehydrogenase n=1 Tax=Aurantiacibacter gangjinensis TaxID=502682 RepID=A0A0G9MM62_9SPHN|nr:NAD-dependent succinate-semialdehyde dehydrogenase [Aurantiacibacter gangjinensis]APE27790.1 2-ketoglutaric semialdehyde dehydrogenase [Aurantiacibacter gangjinensis]KLE31782.1 aldehyde dehydrogenase [Aurantiacibacter gangjinensis]